MSILSPEFNRASDNLDGKNAPGNARLIPNNQDEIILSIKQPQSDAYVDIRAPKPKGLELAKSDLKSIGSRFIYVSSLSDWRAFNSNNQLPAAGGLLVFDISAHQMTSLEEAREQIQLVLGDDAVFFGDIPDTYMGQKKKEGSGDGNIDLFGFTKIDSEYVAVYIVYMSQGSGAGGLENHKTMMEDYFLDSVVKRY